LKQFDDIDLTDPASPDSTTGLHRCSSPRLCICECRMCRVQRGSDTVQLNHGWHLSAGCRRKLVIEIAERVHGTERPSSQQPAQQA